MRTRTRWLAIGLLAPLLLGGCKDGTEPEPDPVVTGSWSGSSQGITLNLTLIEDAGGGVAGSGNVSGTDGNFALVVRQGTHAYPNLSLLLGAAGFTDMNFTGRLSSATQIAGTLNGSGFNGFAVNLTKR